MGEAHAVALSRSMVGGCCGDVFDIGCEGASVGARKNKSLGDTAIRIDAENQ